MSRQLPSLASLRAFEAAARLGSFKKAAEELVVTATAISHRIRVLEENLGRPLFRRKVRRVELTLDGVELFDSVRNGFETISAGIERIRRPRRASVTLSATPAFATKWLVPRLASFQVKYPDIDLHVHASNEPVDLNAGTADLAIRYGYGCYAGTTSTLLLQDCFAPVASPMLHAAKTPDMTQWPLIHFDWHRSLPVDLTWSAWANAANVVHKNISAGIRYSEESHAIQAAVAGQGVALLSLLLVEEELRLGLLTAVSSLTLDGLSYHVLKSNRYPISDAALIVESWLINSAYAI
jgi:LysR family glycine cleavage system transcriptional activator